MREEDGLAPEKLKGKLTFEKVTFSYSSRPDNKALEVKLCISFRKNKIVQMCYKHISFKQTKKKVYLVNFLCSSVETVLIEKYI